MRFVYFLIFFVTGKKLGSPDNKVMKLLMASMMTPVIANKLKEKKPSNLLRALNDNCETPIMIWNGTMRKQLQEFIVNKIELLSSGDNNM